MSSSSLIALFGTMLVLAIIPGPAVFAIIARSFSSGFTRAVYMSLGVLFGDYIFIILALFGLSSLAEMMGSTFIVIRYLSAAYLVWLGYQLLTSKTDSAEIEESKESSLLSNFLTGLLITLGNPKAILFYVGFFPAFINVEQVSHYDILSIMAVATLAFGTVNVCYSFLGMKAKSIFTSSKAASTINRVAGTIMVSTGTLIALKS